MPDSRGPFPPCIFQTENTMAQATTPRGGEPVEWRKRTCTLTIRPLAVISGFIVMLICWTCIFILGVMAGRNSADKQQLAAAQQPQAEKQEAAHAATPSEGQAIIGAMDLRYQHSLKKKGLVDPAPEKNAPQPKPFKPAVAPAANAPAVTQPGTPAGTTPPSQLVQNTVPADTIRYDYVYQLATFNASEERRIDSLRESLEGEGFRTRVKRTGNQRALQLVVRGTTSVEEDVARAVKRLKLGDPWLRQKTPVK